MERKRDTKHGEIMAVPPVGRKIMFVVYDDVVGGGLTPEDWEEKYKMFLECLYGDGGNYPLPPCGRPKN